MPIGKCDCVAISYPVCGAHLRLHGMSANKEIKVCFPGIHAKK